MNTKFLLLLACTAAIAACATARVQQRPEPADSSPKQIEQAKQELTRTQEQAERQRQLEQGKRTR